MSLADSLKSLNEFDINDLDVNNAGIWPAPIKFIVVLIIFGLIAGGGYWFFIKDQYAQLERVERTEQELRKTYEEKAYQVANLEVFKAQMAEMEETFGALVRQLPSETEVPGLLEDITNTALGSGLALQEVKLQPEQRLRQHSSWRQPLGPVLPLMCCPLAQGGYQLTATTVGRKGGRSDKLCLLPESSTYLMWSWICRSQQGTETLVCSWLNFSCSLRVARRLGTAASQ